MPDQNEERRHNLRRFEDLEKLYSELKAHIEVVKLDSSSTKSMIQSNANMLQANQRLLEGKLDNLKEIVTLDIKRVDLRSVNNEEKIEELAELANKVKGSLAIMNWIGIGTFGMALIAFVKVFLIK